MSDRYEVQVNWTAATHNYPLVVVDLSVPDSSSPARGKIVAMTGTLEQAQRFARSLNEKGYIETD